MKVRLGLLFCGAVLMAAAPVWADKAPLGSGKDSDKTEIAGSSSLGLKADGAAADIHLTGWGSNSDDSGTNWILRSRERRIGDGTTGNGIPKSQKRSNLNMAFGNRNKPEKKPGRAGFVEARLEELRRRWEAATDEREKAEVSEQIREWQSFRPERSAPSGGRR